MRTEILDYIDSLSLGGFSLSQELPYDTSGESMYLRNPKKIYVDNSQINLEGIIYTLDGNSIANKITSVKVYFAADAKQLPPSYSDLIDQLSQLSGISAPGVTRRDVQLTTDYINDMLVTELEYRFTKLN